MARDNNRELRLDAPKGLRTGVLPLRKRVSRDRFGRFTEGVARAMGTPWFLFGLTVFTIAWLLYNTYGPENLRFDSAVYGYWATLNVRPGGIISVPLAAG